MKKLFLTCFCCASAVLGARAQDEHIVIWDNASAPTSSGLFGPTVIEKEVFVANNNVAELFVYKAEEPSGRAVVVCPGGGYHNLAIGYEGYDMARWLADHGTTAAVLKYRMPNGHCEVPRNDAEQALRIMREHAAEWGYDASRVGIVGSSAGGHLAASTGTISDEKPAFMILFYPVITAEEGKLHKNSFKYLLGKDYSPEEARNYSLEKRVSALTPPTLLLLSDDDRIVPPVNSLLFYEALKRNGVKASIHVFPTGDHGWGIKPEFKYIEQWQRYALDWLNSESEKHQSIFLQDDMKRAIQFGAGNIGRGFIGAVLSEAGYHVVFADVNMEVIDRINKDGAYTVHIMDVESRDVRISNISGVDSGGGEIVDEIVRAEIITTAVGLRILPFIAPAIAKGIAARRAAGVGEPLNVIACENGIRATSQLREEVYKHLSAEEAAWCDAHVGFADCSVDRIVPPVRSENPIDVVVENFYEWNVEEKSFVGGAPHIEGMNLADNLLAYIERKLFTLNTGHAITAYLGRMKGLATIDESIADPAIFAIVKEAMQQSGQALVEKFGFDRDAHFKYIDKIIGRFKNPYLKDDVTRVGREPLRKLSSTDRLVKPMMTAREYGLPCDKLLLGIGAALHYNNPEDPQSVKMQELIAAKGLRQAVSEITSIPATDPVIEEIAAATAEVEKRIR